MATKIFEPETKVFWKSKTLWINGLVVLSLFLADLANLLTTGEAISIVAVLNMLLRVITKSGIKWKA